MLEKHILEHQNKQKTITHLGNTVRVETNLKKRIFQIVILSMLGVFVLFGIRQLFNTRFFQIHQADVQPVYSVSTEQVQKSIINYLANNNAIGLLRGNSITFSPSRLSAALLDWYPSFKNVRTEFTQSKFITIWIDEYVPKYIWCYVDCVFADETGYLYQFTQKPEPQGFIVFRGPLKSEKPEIRNNIFYSEEVKKFFLELRDLLEMYHIEIKGIQNINTDSVIIEIQRINSIITKSGVIKISKQSGIHYIEQTLPIVLQNNDFRLSLESGFQLDYIDLRYPEKIFYKFNNSPQQAVQ